MNVLFINYGDIRTNSMEHIGPFANELTRRGHSCCVAVETNDALPLPSREKTLYLLTNHGDIQNGSFQFPNGKPADIVHAWTPREIVRQLTLAYRNKHPQTRCIVHLEDNEDSILESVYERSAKELLQEAQKEPDKKWNIRLSHPLEYKRFLAKADSVSLITPPLHRLLPVPKETTTITPIIESFPAFSEELREKILKRYKIPTDRKIAVYPGGVSSNNREDIRNLYLAIKLLQDRGTPAFLIKTGPGCDIFENSFEFPLDSIRSDIGYVEDYEIAELLAIADILIQPGLENAFNRERFPCKIPAFLASGRPTLLPRYYLTNEPTAADSFYPLKQSSPEEIATLAIEIFNHPQNALERAQKAQAFAKTAFSAKRTGDEIESLYKRTLLAPQTDQPPRIHEDLESELNDLHKQIENLRSERESLSAVNKEHESKIENFYSERSIHIRKIEQLEERERRRVKTVSWRITMPLRFLRRKLIDPISQTSGNSTETRPKVSTRLIEGEVAEAEMPPSPKTVTTVPSILDAPPPEHPIYHQDYHLFLKKERQRTKDYITSYKHPLPGPPRPKISLLLPVYNVEEKWIRICINSVINQIYENWELCIADDCSSAPHIKTILEEYRAIDERIRVTFRKVNGHISAATNSAFELATGDYIGLVDHDDQLPPHALCKFVDTIAENPHAKLIYSDQDKIDEDGWRFGPHFKPDWNYDLLLGCNMVQQLSLYRRDAYEQAGGMRIGLEGAQDWDLALRVSEKVKESEIVHIPEILYHWRAIPGSTANSIDSKTYAHSAQKKAISEHLQRIGAKAKLESIKGIHWRVIREIPKPEPEVTIIIPFKDQIEDLKACIESVQNKTTYARYKLLLIDNNSQQEKTHRYLKTLEKNPKVDLKRDKSTPFNYSKINNTAIQLTSAPLICLLNSDTEVITPTWLEEMVSHAIRPEIGVVGARLLYPNDHVQHAGVVLGLGGVADHACKHLHKDDPSHMYRALLTGRYSAVTAACMVFRREHWSATGGLDEDNLAVSFNDTDFCLRIKELGFHNLYTPFAELYHKEGQTRGDTQAPSKLAVFHKEAAYMYQRWPNTIWRDPYYNTNLTKLKQDYSYIK